MRPCGGRDVDVDMDVGEKRGRSGLGVTCRSANGSATTFYAWRMNLST